jgi:hypothetical protein
MRVTDNPTGTHDREHNEFRDAHSRSIPDDRAKPYLPDDLNVDTLLISAWRR